MSGPNDDSAVRAEALDPRHSFIVQAPAGSGKTELLIQRYLTLLAGVREPEQVVAITFTRKATAEMRARITDALQAAALDRPPPEAHRAATHALACAVMRASAARDWALLDQPQRMRIDTLDALNAWLAQQLPILSGGIAAAGVVEDPTRLYRLAASRTVDAIADDDRLGLAVQGLLEAADNSMSRLEKLLAAVLPLRDQWLRLVTGSDPAGLCSEIEAALAGLGRARLDAVARALGPDRTLTLGVLLRHAAEQIAAERPDLAAWLDEPSTEVGTQLRAWRAAAELLLTKRGEWRTRLTKREGFGPGHKAASEAMRDLIDSLRDNEELRSLLQELSSFPDPRLEPAQASNLESTQLVLRRLLAELRVLFEQQQIVDYTEIALAAQQALGEVDMPSELLLALDQRIEHILVDEFQDTSHLQFRLLELLTAGWTPGDGRSLFLVGDPMQSIYRFRDADMSLFLRAKTAGVGTVACRHLVLRDNFRSAPEIVRWVNDSFAAIFPEHDQLETGRPRFYASRAARSAGARQCVALHGVAAGVTEGERDAVVAILERELIADPNQSIGILVQSRGHLAGLREELEARGWPVHAVEIDSLAATPLGQDLLGLTRALLHPADRIAWLGLLRSPCCGLTWADLELVAAVDTPTLWLALQDGTKIEGVSPDGQARIRSLRGRLKAGFGARGRMPLAAWVEHCWRLLDGPACLVHGQTESDAASFFRRLDGLAVNGDVDDPAAIEAAFREPTGQGDAPRESGIEIMTIHRAKGLEFDTVVLFGLARQPGAGDPQALYWRELPLPSTAAGRILAAPFTRHTDRLVEYVQNANRELDRAERARVLYVAVTRARERLHVVSQLTETDPPRNSLAAWLWPRRRHEFRLLEPPDREAVLRPQTLEPRLRRLVLAADSVTAGAPGPAAPDTVANRPEFEWVGPAAQHVGTVVHRELQRMANNGGDGAGPPRPAAATRYRQQLALLGVPAGELAAATERVRSAIDNVIADPTGQWILGPHAEAASELRLTVRNGPRLEHLQLDRTFISDAGERWIVDYKTSQHTGGELEAFLAAEVLRYRDQLERYAAALAKIDPRPIRVALYFPLLGALRDWQPASSPARGV